jgi:hypothetical protein
MSRLLLVASERGLWRVPLEEELPRSHEQLSVDVPADEIRALVGAGDTAAALGSDGRFLLWDVAARCFREEVPLDLQECELECASMASDGSLYVGACPPRVWRWRREEGWRELAGLTELAASGHWQGLEAPYEPRVSGLWADGSSVWASISVGGLCCHQDGRWSPFGQKALPRDQRGLAFLPPLLYLASGQGLWSLDPANGSASRLSLPPRAAFAARFGRRNPGSEDFVLAAAPGPPATWRGPDGSRMSVWHFAAHATVGRPVAGPFHGVIVGMALDRELAWVATDDGELWRVPLAGPAPDQPLVGDFPALRGLFLIDEPAPRG